MKTSKLILLKFVLIVFVFIPDMVGYFIMLRWYDNHLLVAWIGALFLEVGGGLLTVFNSILAIASSGTGILESVIIMIGIVPSIFSMLTFLFLWVYIGMGVSAGNVPKFAVVLSGLLVYLLFTAGAFFIEIGLIPADAPRVGGLSYTISNLQMALEPVVDVMQSQVLEPQTVGETVNETTQGALNTTTGNSSTT
jgi:hypothetical protein